MNLARLCQGGMLENGGFQPEARYPVPSTTTQHSCVLDVFGWAWFLGVDRLANVKGIHNLIVERLAPAAARCIHSQAQPFGCQSQSPKACQL